MNRSENITRIKAVYNALEELQDKVVFVGGATVSLYADHVVSEPRPTDDVDVIMEIASYNARIQLEEKLRDKGFAHDIESGIVCRYQIQGITVDIMPTLDSSIGFNAKWYAEGFQNAIPFKIDDRHTVQILSAPYFIASKLEAFIDRGRKDGRTSQDFEDIIFVLEHRSTIWTELSNTNWKLKTFLIDEFRKLHTHPQLFEWIDGHVERIRPRATDQIISNIEQFVKG